jgi:hypothetical protein
VTSTGAQVVRGLRALSVLAVFAAHAFFTPALFQADGTVTIQGQPPLSVVGYGPTPGAAKGACTAALSRTVARSEALMAPRDSPSEQRARALARLTQFVQAHPELEAAFTKANPARQARFDIERIRLERERERIEADLARGVPPAPENVVSAKSRVSRTCKAGTSRSS